MADILDMLYILLAIIKMQNQELCELKNLVKNLL